MIGPVGTGNVFQNNGKIGFPIIADGSDTIAIVSKAFGRECAEFGAAIKAVFIFVIIEAVFPGFPIAVAQTDDGIVPAAILHDGGTQVSCRVTDNVAARVDGEIHFLSRITIAHIAGGMNLAGDDTASLLFYHKTAGEDGVIWGIVINKKQIVARFGNIQHVIGEQQFEMNIALNGVERI